MTFILAEAGTNHLGRTALAMDHVDAAWMAGCDGVKFQLFTKSELFCPMEGDERRKERWDRSVMSLEEWKKVREHARRRGIQFVVSVFQFDGIQLANELDLDYVKVASRANRNFPYHKFKAGLPIIVSLPPPGKDSGLTWGMTAAAGGKDATFLQCCPKYPSPLKESLWDEEIYAGISDHSGTVWPAIDACFKGAKMVEVHFALDDAGPDKAVCLTPQQLKLICEARDAAATMRSD